MLIPVRCPSCGKVLADKWEYYKRKCEELDATTTTKTPKNFANNPRKELLDELGLEKYCCRRVFLGHVDLIDEL